MSCHPEQREGSETRFWLVALQVFAATLILSSTALAQVARANSLMARR